MKLVKSLMAAVAATLMVGVGAVSAQTAAPAAKPAAAAPAATAPAATATKAAAAPAATAPKAAKVKKAKSAISIACSAEADAKKLKGKDRKKFRSACMKKAKAAKAPKKAA